MPRATLSATERIKNSQEITTLIRQGQAFFLAPYKVYYTWAAPANTPVQVAFAVPKRKFGKAVMRNKLKRLSREGYRLQKQDLIQLANSKGKQLKILFMYQSTQVHTQPEIFDVIQAAIGKIVKQHG